MGPPALVNLFESVIVTDLYAKMFVVLTSAFVYCVSYCRPTNIYPCLIIDQTSIPCLPVSVSKAFWLFLVI